MTDILGDTATLDLSREQPGQGKVGLAQVRLSDSIFLPCRTPELFVPLPWVMGHGYSVFFVPCQVVSGLTVLTHRGATESPTQTVGPSIILSDGAVSI